MTDPEQQPDPAATRWLLTITAEAEVIPGDPPTEED